MGGDIVDDPVRICPRCLATHLEDAIMYEDPERCPRCGAVLTDHTELEGEDEDEK